MDICLSTLNATYQHASLGLRYLKANLGPWKDRCEIKEFTLANDLREIVWELKILNPKIIGFGVYSGFLQAEYNNTCFQRK